MTTVTTERLRQIASGNAFTCTQDDESASMAAELLAVREAQSGWTNNHKADAALVMLDRIETTSFVDDDRIDEVKRLIRQIAAPPAPAVPADYQHLKHVSESYFAVEKRLFDLAQRLKGPSFDHYAYSLNQAIDVLDKEIFGEGEESGALLTAAPTPTKAVPCGSDCATLNVDRKTYGKAFRVVESDDDQG